MSVDEAVQLACPAAAQPVERIALDDPDRAFLRHLAPVRRTGPSGQPVGLTPTVMLRADGRRAYPVIDDVPIMLVPEALVEEGAEDVVDLADAKYAEAYTERDHYDRVALDEIELIEGSSVSREIEFLQRSAFDPELFPRPRRAYIDAPYETTAQWRAFEHLAPLTGKSFLQIGGRGTTAVKLLFAGLREAWLVTPMLGEARYARELARRHGVEDRLRCVVGLGEELPFVEASFDLAFTVGSLHHMVTDLAFAEFARTLRRGGRFAAIEPWRAPGHAVGTRLLGKREAVQCRPLDEDRVASLAHHFGWSAVTHHGVLTRYPLLALNKLGVWLGMNAVWGISRVDDRVASLKPSLQRWGSAVAVLAVKG